jgi:predicted Zn-dependent protease
VRNLVYGENPRYGWFEGTHFYHPVLGLEMTIPSGWQTEHTHSALTAAASDKSGVLQMTLARDAAGKSPGEYVIGLTTDGKVAGSRGGPETLGNWPAWVGTLTVPDGQGGQSSLVAGFVRVTPDVLLQFLGRGRSPGDGGERAAFATIRSISTLTDPLRGMVQPARIRLQTVVTAGDFRGVYASLGSNLIPAEEAAIINGVEMDETVMKGQWFKLVDKIRRP